MVRPTMNWPDGSGRQTADVVGRIGCSTNSSTEPADRSPSRMRTLRHPALWAPTFPRQCSAYSRTQHWPRLAVVRRPAWLRCAAEASSRVLDTMGFGIHHSSAVVKSVGRASEGCRYRYRRSADPAGKPRRAGGAHQAPHWRKEKQQPERACDEARERQEAARDQEQHAVNRLAARDLAVVQALAGTPPYSAPLAADERGPNRRDQNQQHDRGHPADVVGHQDRSPYLGDRDQDDQDKPENHHFTITPWWQ